ncbi:hypothetical protein DPMN_013656 [Dreissena polymorpha]|uniref:Uncharacterized protein n=1 Tax=Dreissena polymorpha TaxID=45954 RepID=A0A9D4N4L7_DREPO|nr:hypothetical protein DPMN_013656 [Dreissena polymorpha]
MFGCTRSPGRTSDVPQRRCLVVHGHLDVRQSCLHYTDARTTPYPIGHKNYVSTTSTNVTFLLRLSGHINALSLVARYGIVMAIFRPGSKAFRYFVSCLEHVGRIVSTKLANICGEI